MILYKSLFNSFAEVSTLWITESKDVSFANNFTFDDRLSPRTLIQIEKGKGTKINPWGTSALTPVHEETFPSKYFFA